MRLILILALYYPILLHAQNVQIIAEKTGFSFRGLSVVDENIIWVSGSNGTVGKTLDGGNSWQWMTIRNHEKRDFRDIEAFDENIALIMAVDEPGIILKTIDGGAEWNTVLLDSTKGIFLDAMDFNSYGRGVVIGDPVKGKLYEAETFDNGNNWIILKHDYLNQVKEGEALFASSGTNIRLIKKNKPILITGGKTSRLWIQEKTIDLPIIQGCNSCGGNSIAYWSSLFQRKIVIVGGDFMNHTQLKQNCIYSIDFGKTWINPTEPPHGYRSCVEFISRKKLITCGTSGVDLSTNGGKTWNLISNESFHVCKKAKSGNAVFLAGKDKIARLSN